MGATSSDTEREPQPGRWLVMRETSRSALWGTALAKARMSPANPRGKRISINAVTFAPAEVGNTGIKTYNPEMLRVWHGDIT